MASTALAPGARVLIRDAEWIVKRVDWTGTGGHSIQVVGVSEIVRHREARFLSEIEGKSITILDPAEIELVPDTSSQFRDSRLYIESLLRHGYRHQVVFDEDENDAWGFALNHAPADQAACPARNRHSALRAHRDRRRLELAWNGWEDGRAEWRTARCQRPHHGSEPYCLA